MVEDWIMVTCLLYVFSCILCVCVCVLWGIVSLLWVFSVFYSGHFPFLSLPHPLPPSKKENNALMFSLLIKDTWIPLEWWKHEPQFPSHISLWFRSRNLLEIRTLFWSELHVETVLGITLYNIAHCASYSYSCHDTVPTRILRESNRWSQLSTVALWLSFWTLPSRCFDEELLEVCRHRLLGCIEVANIDTCNRTYQNERATND